MSYPVNSKNHLFPINYIVTACNISRSTILRLEDEGLLIPSYIDPDSGYRYYSSDNIAQIAGVLRLQNLGFSKKEILEMHQHPDTAAKKFEEMKHKYELHFRELEDISANTIKDDSVIIRKHTLNGGTFFTKCEEIIYTPENLRQFSLNTISEFISSKLTGDNIETSRFFIDEPGNAKTIGQFDGKKHHVRALVPVSIKKEVPNIVHIDACVGFTLVCRCNYNNSSSLFKKIWSRAYELGYKPDGVVAITGFPDIYNSTLSDDNESTLRLMLRTTQMQ